MTAQRRSERLTDVPIAMTVLSSDQLSAAGVRSMTDLTAMAPGVNIATNGAYAQPVVRGVTSTVISPGSDSNVATYIDGVYQPNQVGNYADLVGIEQIEILKGPQGTLFGRNATGGAIVIHTRDPKFTPGFEATASYGSFDEVRLTAYANVPVTDRVAVNLSALYGDDNGFMRNIATGNRTADYTTKSIRGKLLFDISDKFKALASIDYSNRENSAPFALAPLNGNNANIARAGIILPHGRKEVSLSFDPTITTESVGSSLKLSYDLDFATLTSITSYRERDNYILTDSDRLNLPISRIDIDESQDTFTQEINLVSNGDTRARWFTGLYYYSDDASSSASGNLGVPTVTKVKTEAIAPFAEVDFSLTDRLHVIGGLRYNVEKKDYKGFRGPASIFADKTFKNLTPRFGLRYAPNDISSVYATWSKGFKSGLFDTGSFSNRIIKPEKLKAYEVGYKYGRSKTYANLSAFYYDYTDIQFQVLNPAGTGTVTQNAAKAEIYGAEFDVSFQPFEELQIRAAGAYTHARYLDFSTALIYQPLPAGGNALILLGQPNPLTGVINTNGATGNRLMRTPEFSGNLTANYKHEMSKGARIELSSTLYYSGSYFESPQNRVKQDAYTLLSAEIAYVPAGGRLRLSLWGRNLTDTSYNTYVIDTLVGDAAGVSRPRSMGVAASVTF